MPTHALIQDGIVWDLFEGDPLLPRDCDVREVAGVPGIAVGWLAKGGGAFAAPPPAPPPSAADLEAYAAQARYAREIAGLVVAGVSVATDRQSQAMITGAFAYLQASGEAAVRFKAASGWITLDADQVKALALAVGAHVQACFAVEDGLASGIVADPPSVTTFAEIDAAFAAL